MENVYDELTKALSMARAVRTASQSHANSMVALLSEPGVLEGVAGWRLRELKIALQRFNMRTQRWKKP